MARGCPARGQACRGDSGEGSPGVVGVRVRPRSGGLVDSPLFSNMARRFLTWLMLAVYGAMEGVGLSSMILGVCWSTRRAGGSCGWLAPGATQSNGASELSQ